MKFQDIRNQNWIIKFVWKVQTKKTTKIYTYKYIVTALISLLNFLKRLKQKI